MTSGRKHAGTRYRCMAAVVVAGVAAMTGTAFAAGELAGSWQRSDGTSRIRMAPCGDGVCGTVIWLQDPANSAGKVGQTVFRGMKQTGDGSWTGTAFNPEDGRTYSGKASVSGSNLTTQGCAMGGLICKSVTWSRM